MTERSQQEDAVRQFLTAFGFENRVDVETVRHSLFAQRHLNDANASRDYVDQFLKKCERRDPVGIGPLKKRLTSIMNESDETLLMELVVRCRQAHLFSGTPSANNTLASAGSSTQSSPFTRRSASRTRVASTLGGESGMVNESTRSRANTSITSYDSHRMMGVERLRPKSPFRVDSPGQISASNHLFLDQNDDEEVQTNGHPSFSTPRRAESPHFRPTPPSHSLTTNGSSIRAPILEKSSTPLYSRVGTGQTHTEAHFCECLLAALVGIETRLFTSIHRKMSITSTAALSLTQHSVAQRCLYVAHFYQLLAHREAIPDNQSTVSEALLASIRSIIGDYIGDVDELRRGKKLQLKYHDVIALVETWHVRLELLCTAHKLRNVGAMELLDNLFILHRSHSFDDNRRQVLDKVMDYTMGVFCGQMMDWMTSGEPPVEKWMIRKEGEEMVVKQVPVFLNETDARILLEIGKSLPRTEQASDDDLAAIDKATNAVRTALSPKLIVSQDPLGPLLEILRDVVCGIVMRMVVKEGRLKEHIQKATSFFFLTDPRFTETLYSYIKEASLGLRVGSASLNRQAVSAALAAALEVTRQNESGGGKKEKLKFTLDSMTSMGTTPNVSSRLQFVQPLRPKYTPAMDLMKPIFSAVADDYESIFHTIWAIDLARVSSLEAAASLPTMCRFLRKNYALRENASCLLNTLSHVFSVLNATLTRCRSIVSTQIADRLARFLAAVDEKCVAIDDVIGEHRKFVGKVAVITFVRHNEAIEHELANLLRVSFEAQQVAEQMIDEWAKVLDSTVGDENARKARLAEMCQKRKLGVRMLLETVNKAQGKLTELLDHYIAFGNDALID